MNWKIQGIIAVLFLCLVGSIHAQDSEQQRMAKADLIQHYSELNSTSDSRIQLSAALERLADVYNISFMYSSELLVYKSVPSKVLKYDNLTVALKELLEPFSLTYTRLNNRTFAISFDFKKYEALQKQMAQEEIQGTVTDAESGETLPGVNILVKGTTIGASTDSQGNYQLTVPSLQDTLVFSFIGYQRMEVPIDGRTEINISLETEVFSGGELIVVGYGTQEEQEITGSVSRVGADEFVTGNVNNAAELIQGKVPGLTISNPGGNPNSKPTIRLRGISTFSANQSPLIVVDGMIGASLENVDPNDIESVEVLKDASASAIYGTRGAAGVIQVTTKKGVVGAFRVNYNGSVSMVSTENRLDVLSADEFRSLAAETGLTIRDEGHNTDWYKEITQNGYNNSHSLALSGGDETTTYRVSGNFRNSRGIQKTTGFQQVNGRFSLTQEALDDKLDVTFNLAVTDREEDRGFDSAFRYGAIYNPTFPTNPDGFETTGGYYAITAFDMYNPAAILGTGENTGRIGNVNGAVRAEYDFSDLAQGLNASVFYSLEKVNSTNKLFYARTNQWAGGASPEALGRGEAERSTIDDKNELFEVTVNYLNEWSQLRLETVTGYSFNDFISEGTSAGGGDFISDYVEYSNLAFAQDFRKGLGDISSFDNSHRIIGFFGRVNLNWDDTYFLNGSIRREASSRFGENNKWGTFGSVGAGIELTNVFDISFFDQLKLRSSYGITGQDAPFSGISKVRYGPNGFFYANGDFVQKFGPVSNSNPDLKWEENREFNFGVDFELIDSRLDATVEYYIKDTQDLLFNVQVPVPPNLYPTGWRNIGNLENKGFDASLKYSVFQEQEINWNTGFTYSTFNTNLKKYVTDQEVFIANAGAPGQNSTDMVRIKEGEPIGQIWGPVFSEISPDGEWLFLDNDGGKITFDEITREDERVIGNGLPKFSLGWTNSFSYKNWDLNAFVRGVFGHDMVNTFRLFYEAPSQITTYNVLSSAKDISNLVSSPKYSSFYVEDASFVRLQNLSIGYAIPLPENSQLRRFRLSLSGNNLFTITGYNGIDPEVNFIDPVDGGSLAPGIERRDSWFTVRSLSVGIDLEF